MRSHETTAAHETAPASLPVYNDSDILISVSGKDADMGNRVVLPAPKLPASLDPSLALATYSGLYREFISPAQNAATKAAKGEYKVKREVDGKEVEVALGVAEALADFASTFKPSEDRTLPTIGAKRMDIAKEMIAKAMAARGLATDDASVSANVAPWLAGPKGTGDNAKLVDAALHDFITSPYKVTKKGSKAGGDTPAVAATEW